MSSLNVDLEAVAAATSVQNSRQPGVSNNSQRRPSFGFVIPVGIWSPKELSCYVFIERCSYYVLNLFDIQRASGLLIYITSSMIFLFLDPLCFYSSFIKVEGKQRFIDEQNSLFEKITTLLILFLFGAIVFCLVTLIIRVTSLRTRAVCSFDIVIYLSIMVLRFIIVDESMTHVVELIVMNLFLFTYLFAVIRISVLFTTTTKVSGILAKAKWKKAFFNLLLYMHAAHVFGALWYYLAIPREIMCFKNNKVVCDLGIFEEAIRSGILKERQFLVRLIYCLRWGLQTISCFSQNVKPSKDWWENVFVIIICIYALVLFAFLVGNIQTYLKSKTESQRAEPKEWMSYKTLPRELQNEARKYQPCIPGTGVDMENWFKNLPTNLQKKIKLELCLELLRKVEEFENLSESSLKYLCNFLKPVSLMKRTFLIRKGDTILEMLFVVQGKLRIFGSTTRSFGCKNICICKNKYLKDGDICGKELATWVQGDLADSLNLPIATKSIQVISNVEAFALLAVDLKTVFAKQKAAVLIQSLGRPRRNMQASTRDNE